MKAKEDSSHVKEENFSQISRNYISLLSNIALTLYPNNKNVYIDFIKYMMSNYGIFPDCEIQRRLDVLNIFAKKTLITDMYMSLNEKNNFDKLNEKDEVLFKLTKKAAKSNIYKYTLDYYDLLFIYIHNSLTKLNESKYQKYLTFVLLKEEDIELLSSYNPLFKYEYESFNFELTSEFVLSEIENLRKTETYQNAISELNLFLIMLYEVDSDLVNDVFADMIEDLGLDRIEFIDRIDEGDLDYLKEKLKDFSELNRDLDTKKLN